MENLITRGTFVEPEIEFVVESMIEKLGGNKPALIHDKEDINIALQLMEKARRAGTAGKQISQNKPKLPKATLDFKKILDIPHPSDKVEGPRPTGGGVRFMEREKIMIQTNRYGIIYGYINTMSCQIMAGTGESFSSPTKFIAKYRSINAHPNNDIIFVCGNPYMIEDVVKILTEQEFPLTRLRREKYYSKK